MNAAPEEKKILGAHVGFCQLFASAIVSQNLLQLTGDAGQFLHGGLRLFGGHRAAHLRQV